MNQYTYPAFSALLMLLSYLTANAQKLPSVQQASLRAPAIIKIDGNSTEWPKPLQAYNNSTNLFYTMANDDENLYLVIQVTEGVNISKIISAGITLIINKQESNGDKNAFSLTYPIFDVKDRPNINVKDKIKIVPGSTASLRKADSVMQVNNKRLSSKSKFIRVTGFKGMDSLISVYNQDGIKAAELLDNKVVYTYELSIALKQLGLSVDDAAKFAYTIKSNGTKMAAMNGYVITKTEGRVSQMMDILPGAYTRMPDLQILISTTDFSGEYTLVKK